MKSIRLIFVSLCAITLLMMQSCAKEQWGADDHSDAIAQPAVPSGADGEEAVNPTEDEGSGNGDNDGNGGGSENGGESTTPVEKPEFIDNHDWSAYDENEYLIGFGAMDENSQKEGEKVAINLSNRAVTWEGGEEATVYVPATRASGTYAYDATREQFRPVSDDDIVALGNNLAYVYYPSSLFKSYSNGTATVTMPAAVTANNVDNLGDKLPMAGIIPANQGKPYPTVTFRNLVSVLRVQLTGCEKVSSVVLSNSSIALVGDGSVTWSGDTSSDTPTFVTTGATKSITVSCDTPVTLNESTATEFYFFLPSSGSMSEMTVQVNFSQNEGPYTYTPYITKSRNGAMTLERNKIVKLAFRAGFFSGGKGTEDDPYQIATPADLSYLQRACSGYGVSEAQYGYNATAGINYFRGPRQYLQTADIDFDGEELVSIGSASRHFFGSYDGGNHTISDMVIDDDSYWVGLFGYVDGGTIENLTLSDFSVSSTNKHSDCSAGALAGLLDNDATVSGCTVVSSTVTGVNCGGLVGYVEDGTVSKCIARGVSVTAANTTDGGSAVNSAYCGGIAGCIKDGSVSACSLYGAAADGTGTASAITGVTKVGGIAGIAAYDSGTSEVRTCYVSNASISASGDYAGGQVGYMYSGGTIYGNQGASQELFLVVGRGKEESPSGEGNVTITSSGDCVGGAVGYNAGNIYGYKITNGSSYILQVAHTSVSGRYNVGGLVGRGTGNLHTCYVNNTTVQASQNAAGGIIGYVDSGTLTDCLTRYMTITAGDDENGYGYNVGGVVGRMDAGTIDNSDATAAGGTSNVLKGHNSVGGVVGLMRGGSLTGSTSQAVTSSSTIQALKRDNSLTPGNVGGVVGKIDVGPATITNCKATGCSITSMVNTGGILGFLYDNYDGTPVRTSKILNCSVASMTYSITNSAVPSKNCSGIGGIVGQMTSGTVEKCRNGSNLSAPAAYYVGGIVGNLLGGTVHLCYSAGSATVTGHSRVGGLVGIANSSKAKILIINSASRSAVTSTSYESEGSFNCSTGGLVGRMQSSTQDCVMANCVGLGSNVLKNSDTSHNCICIGGIVGYAKDVDVIRNCYSQRTDATMKYKNSTNVPTAAGSKYGGIYGHLDGTSNIWDCYSQTTAVGVAGGSTTSVNNQKVASTVVTSNGKLQATLYSGTKFTTDTYFRIVLAFGASTATSGTVAEDNLVAYTGSSGETFKMSNWTRPEADAAVPAYPLPNKLYNLGTDYYSN